MGSLASNHLAGDHISQLSSRLSPVKTSLHFQITLSHSRIMATRHGQTLDDVLYPEVGTIKTGILGVDTWYVFGGSWGSTLSLSYAIFHPDRVKALMLRGIFMCRRSELLWFYQEGASHIFPDKLHPYREHIPVEERGDLIAAYYKRLTSTDGDVRRAAAKQWCLWEMGTSKLIPDTKYIDKADNLDFAA